MASADLLILLSDVAGLYDAPPAENPGAKLIPLVPRITPEIEAMAGGAASILLARRHAHQDRGGQDRDRRRHAYDHRRRARGASDRADRIGRPCTWFLTGATPVTARKKWIAGTLIARGALTVDDGAVKALLSGKSLLPAGVTKVEGEFSRGDCVIIRDMEGHELGRGLANYDADDATKIAGHNSAEIETLSARRVARR